jgi:hypothetical protein
VEVVPGKCFTSYYFHFLDRWTEPENKKAYDMHGEKKFSRKKIVSPKEYSKKFLHMCWLELYLEYYFFES